jgi:hypothetical protein
MELTFYYTNAERSFFFLTWQDILRVRYRTWADPTWQTIQTFDSDVANWTEVVLTLPNPHEIRQIAFEAESQTGHGVCIDDVEISVSGDLEEYMIMASAGENGSIDPSGDVVVFENSDQTFFVSGDPGYQIEALLVDNEPVEAAVGEDEFQYTFFEVNQNHSISATFTEGIYTVSVAVNPADAGTIEGEGEYLYNDTVTLTATPVHGYDFVNWTEDGEVMSVENPMTFNVTSHHNIEANFELSTWTIAVTVDPEDAGTVEGWGDYLHNSEVELTAIPNDNYEFVEWMENGEVIGSENPIVFVADNHRDIMAKFAITTGIASIGSREIVIYPNPSASGIFNVKAEAIESIEVYDLYGKLIFKSSDRNNSSVVDLSGYSKGVYYLKLQTDEGTGSQKIIFK